MSQFEDTTASGGGGGSGGSNYVLTTGANTGSNFLGSSGDDFYDGGLSSGGSQTLNALDQLDGGAGNDTLAATITGSVTPSSLANIETVALTYSMAANTTVDLSNAAQLSKVEMVGNTGAFIATAGGIRATTVNLGVYDTAQAATFTYGTNVTSGSSDSANLTVRGVTGGANITLSGIETINLTSNTSASSINIVGDALKTLNVSGSAALTVGDLNVAGTTTVSKVDASQATGAITLTMGAQTGVAATTDISVTGGAGNDSITMTGVTQDYTVSGGAGNDTFTDTGITAGTTTGDSISGGDGTDTLATNEAQVDNLTSGTAFSNITGIERLSFIDGVGADTYTTEYISTAINTVRMQANTAGAATIVGGAGSFTIEIGTGLAGSTPALGHALVVQDTGSATTDALTITNRTAATNAFGGQAITSTGYETLTINSTGTGAAIVQTLGAITVTGDTGGTSAEKVVFSGNNAVDALGVITADIIDASTLSGVNAADGYTFDMVTASTATSITGSEGNDDLHGHTTTASSVTAGAGDDVITGGSGNDTLAGGAGNDSITSGSGNDNISGGDGNDTITVAGNLTANDTIAGGAGTDKLSVSAAVSAALANVTEIETFKDTAGVAQDFSYFTGTTIATIEQDTGTGSYTNVGAGLTKYKNTAAITAATVDRATDTSSDSIAVDLADNVTVTTLTVDDEETVTITGIAATSGALNGVAIGTLSSGDLTTLNVAGAQALTITTLTAAALDAINISATGNVNLGTLSTSALSTVTITGTGNVTLSAASNLDATTLTTTGSGAVTITTGSGADRITTGAGADTITVGSGADSVDAGDGADTVYAGQGIDTLAGGAGSDTLDVSAGWTIGTSTDGASGVIRGLAVNLGSTALLSTTIDDYVQFGTWAINADLGGISAGGLGRIGNTAATATDRVSSVSGFEKVVGSSGADYIVGTSAANTITGGTGADIISGGAGADTHVVALAASVAASAVTFAGGTVANGDTITFGNGVDVILGFVSGTDFLSGLYAAALPATLIGQDQTNLAASAAYQARGTFTASTGAFVFGAAGPDTLVVYGGAGVQDALSTNTSMVVLVGNTGVVAADFIA